MTDPRMQKADMVTGAILFVLSVAVLYGAWTMDRLGVRQIHPLSAPGLTPGLLGLALAVTSALLILRSARGLGREAKPSGPSEPGAQDADPGAVFRLVAATALCLSYALGLVGRMPFWLATAIFVTAFIAVFEWERGGPPMKRLIRLAWALFLGLATGYAVTLIFRDLFLVRLP